MVVAFFKMFRFFRRAQSEWDWRTEVLLLSHFFQQIFKIHFFWRLWVVSSRFHVVLSFVFILLRVSYSYMPRRKKWNGSNRMWFVTFVRLRLSAFAPLLTISKIASIIQHEGPSLGLIRFRHWNQFSEVATRNRFRAFLTTGSRETFIKYASSDVLRNSGPVTARNYWAVSYTWKKLSKIKMHNLRLNENDKNIWER